MSTPEIDSTTVNDEADFSNLTPEQMLRKIAELKQENNTLRRAKDKVGLAFKRVPEDGNEAIQKIQDGQFPYLTRVPELSVDKKDSLDGSIALIEGENLAALAALQMTHKGKVDVIYIDPPYNTGNDDFIYEDKRVYKSTEEELENVELSLNSSSTSVRHDDPYRHSKWLSFMERRLFLAREILSETGAIFVSIDDHEQARLKLLMDHVFGSDNFVALIPVVNNQKGNNDQIAIAGTHEYVIVYSKVTKAVSWNGLPLDESRIKEYCHKDKKGMYKKGAHLMATGADAARHRRPKLFYPVYVNFLLNEIYPERKNKDDIEVLPLNSKGQEMRWRWSSEKMFSSLEDIIISKQSSGKIDIFKKQRLEDIPTYKPKSIFNKPEYSGTTASAEMRSLFTNSAFSYPKSKALIQDFIFMSAGKDALVLDFFAGSGTTGHAVAELNKEDGGTRSCILVTNNEANIARDVTQKRLERVLTGKEWADGKEHEPLPGSLSYFTLDFTELPSNPMSRAQKLEHSFEGLAMLEQDALNVVDADPDKDYAMYRNADKLVVVWKDFHSVLDGDCEELLDALRDTMDVKDFVVYVPSEMEEGDLSVDGWNVIAMPHLHIERYQSIINRMRQNQTLPSNN